MDHEEGHVPIILGTKVVEKSAKYFMSLSSFVPYVLGHQAEWQISMSVIVHEGNHLE